MPRFALAVLALSLAAPPAALAGDAWRDPRGTYRDNLAACVSHSPRCDRDALSRDDREYLAYELKGQRFDPGTVRQVVDVRMEAYDLGASATPAPAAPVVITQDMVEAGALALRQAGRSRS